MEEKKNLCAPIPLSLLLLRPKPLVQRQRDGRTEVLLFFHSLLLSASPEASKA